MSVLGRMGRAAQGAMSMADKMSDLRQQEMQNEQTAVQTRRMQEDEIERKRMAEALRSMKESQPQTAPQQGATVSYKAPEQAAPAAPKQGPTVAGDGYANPNDMPAKQVIPPDRTGLDIYKSEEAKSKKQLDTLRTIDMYDRTGFGINPGAGPDSPTYPPKIKAKIADEEARLKALQYGIGMYEKMPHTTKPAPSIAPNIRPNIQQSDVYQSTYGPKLKAIFGNRATAITPELLGKFSQVESRGNQNAVSPKGARGEFQIMPGTFNDMNAQYFGGKLNWNDPHDQSVAAIMYMDHLDRTLGLGGDPQKIASAYFQGPGSYQRNGQVNNRTDGITSVADYQAKFAQPGAVQVAQGAPVPQGQVPQQGAQEPQQPAPTMQSGDYQLAAVNPWIENQQIDYQMRMNELVAMNSGDPQMIMKARLENQGLKLKQFGNHMYAVSHAAARGNPQAVQELVGAYSSYTGTPYTVVPMSNGTVVLATQGQDGGLVPASKPMALQQLVSNISGSVIPGIRDQIIAINAKRAEAFATKAPEMAIQGSKNNTALQISNDRLQSGERNTDVTATGRIVQEKIRAGKPSPIGVHQSQYNDSTIITRNGQAYRVIPAGVDANGLQTPEQVVPIQLPQGVDLSAGGDPSIMPTIAGDGVTQQEYASDPVLAYLD